MLLAGVLFLGLLEIHEKLDIDVSTHFTRANFTDAGTLKSEGLVLLAVGSRGCGGCQRMEKLIADSGPLAARADLVQARLDIVEEGIETGSEPPWFAALSDSFLPETRYRIPQIVLYRDGVVERVWPDNSKEDSIRAIFRRIEAELGSPGSSKAIDLEGWSRSTANRVAEAKELWRAVAR